MFRVILLFCSFLAVFVSPPSAEAGPHCFGPSCDSRSRARFTERDGLVGFGNYAPASAQEKSRVVSTATPTPAATPTSTPAPTATPGPRPGSGQNDLQFLNSLLGGALSQALGGSGLLGGGSHGLFGGGNGGGSNGWGQADQWSGTAGPDKWGQHTDYSQNVLEQLQDLNMQHPGSPDQEVQGDVCRLGPHYFSDMPEGTMLGPGDEIYSAYGPDAVGHGRSGDGVSREIARTTGANYRSFSWNGGTQELLSVLEKAGRGDQLNPITGERQKVLVNFDCHGGGDYLASSKGGVTGTAMAKAVIRGAKQTGNKDISHITIVDGGCMPCRGNNMQELFKAEDMKSFNYFSGASPNDYAWASSGATHISQQILGQLKQAPGTGFKFLTRQMGINAVKGVRNGAYFHRQSTAFSQH